MTDKPLSGQLALVTGASRGIGAATARALAAQGAHVVLTARKVPDLEAVEEAIHAAGGTATIAPLDLLEGDSIARLADAIAGRWDALDIMVLNAALLGSLGPVPATDQKELGKVLALNVNAPVALLSAFDPLLRRSKRGRVVGLTSKIARAPRAYWGVYGASKAALETMLRCYADEVTNISQIRVALVDPGATRTTMRARAYPGEDPASVKDPQIVGDRIAALIMKDFETGALEILGD